MVDTHDSMIPVISLKADMTDSYAAPLGRSFRDFGFAILCDHGIDAALIEQCWALTAAFFALPEDTKRRYILANGAGQRGYTPFAQEIAKGAKTRDLKEFWHVGREPQMGEMLPDSMPANIWPEEISEFRRCFTALYAAFDRVGAQILSAVALYLGLPAHWFEGPTHQGNSILRLLHYPPLDNGFPAGAVRAAAHEDINLITLLLGAEEAGLQLLRPDGRWLDVQPPQGALVVNIGDMLQRLTNHRLPSTTHRVINPSEQRSGISRYSMPFFLHLRPDFNIDALPQCVDASHPRREPAISAEAYLQQRLREIGLM